MADAPLRHSVILCTLDRPDSLQRCLRGLDAQTVPVSEIIQITRQGDLSVLRQEGARVATGELLSFIDDDVVCAPTWAESLQRVFRERSDVVGVSGPAVIPRERFGCRDLFRYPVLKWAYDLLFADGLAHLPGHLTRAGTWTTGAVAATCTYEGPVDFLEACNQTWRSTAYWAVGGYDASYGGIGDWSEPDLACRVRAVSGNTLWFTQGARVAHEVSQTGAYLSRQTTGARLDNYRIFRKRWVKKCFKSEVFFAFMKAYFFVKEIRSLNG